MQKRLRPVVTVSGTLLQPFRGLAAITRKVYMRSLQNLCKAMVVTAITVSLALPAAPKQEPEQAPAQGPALKRTVNLVNLFATVRDKNKRIIGDLKQDDFKIYEDNAEQKISFFSKEVTMPITLGLLIDTSGSEQNRLGAEQEAASRFLERVMKKGDEAMVISFDLDVDLLADFTDDRAQIERSINKARIGAVSGGVVTPGTIPSNTGGTHFYDAVFLACNDKLATEAGRKALVIITDAQDEGSRLRVEEAIEAAQRTDTVIHILLVHDPGFSWRPDVAKKMSDETGGRTIEVSSEKRLNEAFDQISEELRSQYTLGYYPTNTSKNGQFRKVRVETPGKESKILTRKGYYAPKS
jgi:VWFA-related protein